MLFCFTMAASRSDDVDSACTFEVVVEGVEGTRLVMVATDWTGGLLEGRAGNCGE